MTVAKIYVRKSVYRDGLAAAAALGVASGDDAAATRGLRPLTWSDTRQRIDTYTPKSGRGRKPVARS